MSVGLRVYERKKKCVADFLRRETKETAALCCGKSSAAAQVSEVRAARLGCSSPGPTSRSAFQEITAGTEEQLPPPRPTHTHTLKEEANKFQLAYMWAYLRWYMEIRRPEEENRINSSLFFFHIISLLNIPHTDVGSADDRKRFLVVVAESLLDLESLVLVLR